MKTFIVLITLFIVVLSTRQTYDGYKVYLINPETIEQVDYLKSIQYQYGFDFWDGIHRALQPIRVMIPPESINTFIQLLKVEQIPYKVIIEDVTKMVNSEFSKKNQHKIKQSLSSYHIADFEHFWELDEVNEYLEELATNYPNIASLEIIGQSTQLRDIYSIRISKNGEITEKNPIIVVEGTLHAREWIGTMVSMHLIHELVEHSADHDDMLNGLDWIIVPVTNPDGFVYTYTEDRFWRKTRSPTSRPDCFGVDPNRNFAYQWEFASGTSDDPCDKFLYRGTGPSTEPEVRHLSALIDRYSATKLFLSIHSYGQYLLYPWGYDYFYVYNHLEHQEMGLKAYNAIYDVAGTKYKLGATSLTLYNASGVSTDYAVGLGGVDFAFCVELPGGGTQGFDIPAERIPDVLTETFPGLRAFALDIIERYGTLN